MWLLAGVKIRFGGLRGLKNAGRLFFAIKKLAFKLSEVLRGPERKPYVSCAFLAMGKVQGCVL